MCFGHNTLNVDKSKNEIEKMEYLNCNGCLKKDENQAKKLKNFRLANFFKIF